jgi:hypothetical protein
MRLKDASRKHIFGYLMFVKMSIIRLLYINSWDNINTFVRCDLFFSVFLDTLCLMLRLQQFPYILCRVKKRFLFYLYLQFMI